MTSTSKLPKFWTPYNYVWTAIPGEDFTDRVSLTVPDQSMSIKDVMSRFVRGLPLPKLQGMGYSDIDTSPYDNLDRFQKLDLAREFANKQLELRQQLLTEKSEKEKAALEERFRKAVDERATEMLTKNKTEDVEK